MTTLPSTLRALVAELRAAGVTDALDGTDPAAARHLAGFNTRTEHRPAAVVPARSAEDVRAAVAVAARHGETVTAIGHGHGFRSPIAGGIAVDTRGLAHVEVDLAARTATVGAGTTWASVLEAAAAHGLAPLAGSAPHVGVVGYLMGGGLGPVARTFGFAADHVRSVQVVTGRADLVTTDPERHPDLFWALRGGKHGLGIVTEAVIDLFPVPTVQAGGFFFDGADAATVLHAYVDWAAGLPDSVSTSVALLRLPPLPELPEPIRGRFVVHVRVAVVGVDAEGSAALVAPICGAATPLLDGFGELPYAAIGAVHADPVDPMPVVEGGLLLGELGHDTVDALLAIAGPGAEVPLAAVELRLLGGAVGREPAVANAVGGRDAAYSLHVVGAPVPELLDEVVPHVIGGVFAAVAPWATGGLQANFVGSANGPGAIDRAWAPEVAERLATVRAAYDPHAVLTPRES